MSLKLLEKSPLRRSKKPLQNHPLWLKNKARWRGPIQPQVGLVRMLTQVAEAEAA